MSSGIQNDLYEDRNNDKYPEDLNLLNRRKNEWYAAHPKYRMYRRLTFIVLIIGFAAILWVCSQLLDTGSMLPLHLSIWATAVAVMAVHYAGKKVYEKPFNGIHSAHFEAGPKGLYYIYQQGMAMVTYYIKDKDLREILRDDEAHCLYIKGKGIQQIHNRKGVRRRQVNEIYALVGFDEYDLDDLLEPYQEFVEDVPGVLRTQYLASGSEQDI